MQHLCLFHNNGKACLFGFLVEYPDPHRDGQQRVNNDIGDERPAKGADVDVDVPAERFGDGFVELGVEVVGVDEFDDVGVDRAVVAEIYPLEQRPAGVPA